MTDCTCSERGTLNVLTDPFCPMHGIDAISGVIETARLDAQQQTEVDRLMRAREKWAAMSPDEQDAALAIQVNWMPIDTCPEKWKHDFKTVLLWVPDGWRDGIARPVLGYWNGIDTEHPTWENCDDHVDVVPTHWAPWPPQGPM